MGIVLLVCFTVILIFWFLTLVGASPEVVKYSPWLAFFAVLFLGLAVFAPRW